MAQSINKVMILGNLGTDPEFKTFDNGDRICNLSVATNVSWKEPNAETWHERTEWHRLTVKAQNLVSLCERKAQRGSKVFLEGAMETRSWNNSVGNKRWTTEVILRPYQIELKILSGSTSQSKPIPKDQSFSSTVELNDDIPF